jgi:hypothetical protein
VSKKTRGALAAAIGAAAVLFPTFTTGVGAAASSTVEIQTVGGQTVQRDRVPSPLSGTVTATGTANSAAIPPAAQPKPLIADAGDSPIAATGDRAVLLV